MPRVRTGSTDGFTLIEVLLVLLIMSGLFVMMTQLLTSARNTRDTIHNIQENQLVGPAILDRIEEDLRGLFVYDRPKKQVLQIRNRVVGGLDADRIDFVTSVDSLVLFRDTSRFLRADYNEVGYCVRTNPDLDDFLELYRREAFGVDDEPFEGGNYTFLHERIRRFDIQVYEEDGPDAEPLESWGTEDDEQSGLPARIDIVLELEFAPRIVREQLKIAPVEKRRVTYRRVIRFPEMLRNAIAVAPVPVVPKFLPPQAEQAGLGGGAGGKQDSSGGPPGDLPGDLPGNLGNLGGAGGGGGGGGDLGSILGGGGGL